MGNNAAKSHYPKNLTVTSNARRTRWEGPGIPAAPGKPILIPGADESQPEVVAIRWDRSPSNSGSAIVGYLVEHRRLGSQHWVRATTELCTFPEMTLSGLEPGWRYQFRVRAQNAVGFSRPSEISDPLTVTLQRTAAAAPEFDLELKDTVVLENEQAEFVVRFSGTPLPKISWFKDGFEIFSSRRTRIVTDNGKSVLLIHQTALNDEGEIKCTATNRAGHVSTKAKLILEAPPKIRLPRQYEDGLLFEQDETIRLKVSLAGRPLPDVIWYHDTEIVVNDERHIIESMDSESVLKIPDAKRIDRGEYTVKATNKLGDDISSFLVTVTDRPSAPGKATVTMTLGRSVTLSWKEPEDDGGCKIGTYIVEYYRIGWDVWLKACTSRQTIASLIELIEGSEYKFRVKAENPYGVSDPSEESDIIFIPDIKRGITTPALSTKSQSHREISRSRAEKREVSFVVPTQRTRSLTRDEARPRYDESDSHFGPSDRSASAQRLPGSGRPSRADSRVTFALDPLVHEVKPDVPPTPPARSKDHSAIRQREPTGNYAERLSYNVDTEFEDTTVDQVERSISPKTISTVTTVTVSPPVSEESSRRAIYRESISRSMSLTRERSMSPQSMPKIEEYREESPPNSTRHLRPFMNLKLTKQQAVDDLEVASRLRTDDKPGSPTTPREGDENALHGSSEFMLVLYPDDQSQTPKITIEADDNDKQRNLENRSTVEETEDEEDLIPPPMSLSLPELFSPEHQVVETLREAVSSTELLHERAMERFYKAVAAEEASEVAKRKSQLERVTGELAAPKSDGVKPQISVESDASADMGDIRRSSIRRRLSNSGVTQNLISSWQTKKNRRRSSEGQAANATYSTPTKFLTPSLLSEIEARSDPSLPKESATATGAMWSGVSEKEANEPLRRWHDSNVRLVDEKQEEKSIPWAGPTNETSQTEKEAVPEIKPPQTEVKEDEEEIEESLETSEESSEEISSADSEDLKMLKTRILARQVLDEEDTYHPRGTPTPHVELDPLIIPDPNVPSFDVSPPTPVRSGTPVSPSSLVPKSILKKPKEDVPIALNSFGRPIPPEKPIRKSPPQPAEQEEETVENKVEDEIVTGIVYGVGTLRTPLMSESDTDSVLSAGEVAKSRRMHGKTRSITPEEEKADMEARMAVVSHYTEIVREHANRYSYRASEERRFGDSRGNSRRSSVSEDTEQKNDVEKPKEEPPSVPLIIDKQESQEYEVEHTKSRIKSELVRQESQAPSSRRGSVSRGTTPAPESRTKEPAPIKEKRMSRQLSNTEPRAPRSRNVSAERGSSSRSSSKTRVRAPSQDRTHRPPSRTGSEEQRLSREKSVEPGSRYSREKSVESGPRRSKAPSRNSSRTSSRSNSKDRQRPTTPVELKMERLQKALDSKKYRALRRGSSAGREYLGTENNQPVFDEKLAIEAQRNVRSTVDFITDLTLLVAAVYVYLFKKEIMAIPFIALLLYRRIQHEIRDRVSRGWWRSKGKQQ